MDELRAEVERVMHTADCLYTPQEVEQAFTRMASEINRDMAGGDVVAMCVMNGGLVVSGMLIPQLDFALRVDYMHASRYREKTSGDDLHWKVNPSQPLAGKDVLLIDDILDEGYTLEAIIDFLHSQSPASIRSAVAFKKEHDRGVRPPVEYIGLTVPDRYVFGYGMDYKGYWRNAPGVFAVAD